MKIFFKKIVNKVRRSKTRCLSSSKAELCRISSEIKKHIRTLSGQDFQPGHAVQVIQMATDFFTTANENLGTNGYSFSLQYEIRFTVHECKYAAIEFRKLRQIFHDKTDPLAKLHEYENVLFGIFKNAYTETEEINREKNEATVLAACFTGWIKQTISTDYHRLIVNAIVQGDDCLNSKQSFMKRISLDLIQENNFEDFMNYIQDPNSFFIRKLKIFEEIWKNPVFENQNAITSLVTEEVQKYMKIIIKCLRNLKGPFQISTNI